MRSGKCYHAKRGFDSQPGLGSQGAGKKKMGMKLMSQKVGKRVAYFKGKLETERVG